jgi:hypothetical protein
MIGAIRRKFTNPIDEDDWSTEQELTPEAVEPSALQTDAAVLLAAAQAAPGHFLGDESLTDYYKGIVKTAIDNRGRYGDHWIPVPWLRMILAGLESRHIDPDLWWYEADIESAVHAHAEVPPYEDLFPSESDPAARLR